MTKHFFLRYALSKKKRRIIKRVFNRVLRIIADAQKRKGQRLRNAIIKMKNMFRTAIKSHGKKSEQIFL